MTLPAFLPRLARPRLIARGLFFAPALAAWLALSLTPSQAQLGGGLDQQLQNLRGAVQQQQQQQGGTISPGSQVQPADLGTQNYAVPPRQFPLPPSRLEQILSARAGVKLTQFGYDQLGQGRSVSIAQTGAVQDDYILGPGDQIIVSLRGQENSDFRASVDRNGQIVLPRLKPLAAGGRSFGDFRADLEGAVRRAYVATDASVSVASVRQISVLVSGEVNNPGQRTLSGLSSVVDALLLSGGVRKTGSLRAIRIQRGGRTLSVDLYSVLTSRGGAARMQLTDGDRILVPPLGRTVAVAGLVRQPGIFELGAGQSSVAVRALLGLAGGQEVRGRYRLSVLRVLDTGQSSMEPLAGESGTVRDSEILFVQLGADQTTGQATLSGGTGLAGQYAIQNGALLSGVLRAPGALGNAPYTLFGLIVRRDPKTYLRVPLAFSPVAVLNGRQDQQLQSDDVIRVLSVNESLMLNFVVRAYLGRLAAALNTLRNPLTADIDANSTSAMAARLGGNVTRYPGIDPNNPARIAAQAAQVDENQFGMDDALGASADVQRAEITALLDVAAPGSDFGRRQRREFLNQMSQAAASNPGALLEQPATQTPSASSNTQNGANGNANANANTTQNPVQYGVPTATGDDTQATGGDMLSGRAGEQPEPAPNYIDQSAAAGTYASNREVRTFGEFARQLGLDPLVLINFLLDNRARIDGAVAGPGSYFVGPGVGLDDLVQAAGGTQNWADKSGIEILTTAVDPASGRSATERQTLPLRQGMLASYVIRPHDQFRFNRIYGDSGLGSATIQGEVRSVGTYPITRGEHLSDLLLRAGGLTPTAYPQGAVYLRKSAAAVERDGYLRAANEIEDQLLVGMTRVGNDKISPESFNAVQSFVTRLRTQKAVGRVSFVVDPSILAAHPERDPLLEPGDVVVIPQRSSTISVLGEVMQPGTFVYQAGGKLEDYIRKAGGYAQYANEGLTFVVMPDGTARKLDRSWLNFSPDSLPPGSSIVVPRDLTPIDTRQIILDVTGVLSSLAVSLASLAVISR